MKTRISRSWPALVCLAWALAGPPADAEVLIEEGSAMRYLANDADPGLGTAWVEQAFDDAAWPEGVYGVGYETVLGPPWAVGLIRTEVPPGTSSTYTRARFTIADLSTVESLFLGADHDDAFVAWINGVEVYRSPTMPAGTPDWDSYADPHESSNGPAPDYQPLVDISGPGIPALQEGTNLLAIGVWNDYPGDTDLVLVPQLSMNLPPWVTRGPYLQLGTSSSMVIRWRTSTSTDSLVRYGSGPDQLASFVGDPAITTEHEVPLDDLEPDTVYYYAVGNAAGILAGGDSDHYFRTAPPRGTRRPVRVWVLGDSGMGNLAARAVRDAYLAATAGHHTDLWLMLGDNAYVAGTDEEYQRAVFETYPGMLRRSVLWPAFGNHDNLSSSSATQSGPYYQSFSLPAAGDAGGIGSGTEAYWSFDFANVHFIAFSSEDVDPSPGGAMLSWLEADLAANTQDWIVAFGHRPPYSKGHHDSDVEHRMIEMREYLLPVLEDYGVDLVLAGHSHSYERSYLLDGHYGSSDTFTEEMKLDGGDGRPGGTGAYQKPGPGGSAHEGAVYVVAGSSSKVRTAPLDHPAMLQGAAVLGSVVLEFEGDRLTAVFLDDQGTERDAFTVVKNTATPPIADFEGIPRSGPVPLTVAFTDRSTTNAASWRWDLEGDGTVDTVERHPSFRYDVPGAYPISLEASNASGSDLAIRPGYVCASEDAAHAVADLTLADDDRTLQWVPVLSSAPFDVVKGDLARLAVSRGNFAVALTACLENDGTDTRALDPETPSPGLGSFYLVRGISLCGTPGTYDSGSPGQVAMRDPSIADSPVACP